MIPHDMPLTVRVKGEQDVARLPAADSDITFLVQAYKDKHLAVNCLESIRKHYRDSRIVLVLDGDDDPDWKLVASRYGAEERHQERLYVLAKIGEMWKRRLEYYLEKPTAFLIKLDTDSLVNRRFAYMPDAGVFGNLSYLPDGSFNHIVGGCIGFSNTAAEYMLRNKVFDDEGISKSPPDWISRCSRAHWDQWCASGIGSDDCVLSHVCVKYGIEVEVFDEVYIIWWTVPRSVRSRYAVTHPHKL
jgi:hypothetical protein